MSDKVDVYIQNLGNFMSDIETKMADTQKIEAEITSEYTELEKRLINIFTENTGCHICDSSGIYGRVWQRNRKIKNWNDLPAIVTNIYQDSFEYCSLSTYHFLKYHLDITKTSEMLNRKFQKFMETNDESYSRNMEKFCEQLVEDEELDMYVDYNTANTYNFENLLDHTLYFTIFEFKGEEYIILQIHLGCDIRGGYSKPQIFAFSGESDYFHIHMSNMSCTCKKCGMTWDTDDCGSHWYDSGIELPNKSLDGQRDKEFEIFVKDGKVYHKNCKGEIEFYVYWV